MRVTPGSSIKQQSYTDCHLAEAGIDLANGQLKYTDERMPGKIQNKNDNNNAVLTQFRPPRQSKAHELNVAYNSRRMTILCNAP
jgi:hypothetical protein